MKKKDVAQTREAPAAKWPLVAACALAATFFAQSFSSSLQKSATFDEPMHITAGLSYLETGRIVLSPDHPPLLKELSALGLRAGGVRWPATPAAAAVTAGSDLWPSAFAKTLIVENGPDHVLFWARLPLILVSTTLVFAVFLLGRRLIGDPGAVAATFLCAFDPNILAHSYLVTTDVGVATCIVLFVVALWDYIRRPTVLRIVICGLALGAALAAKYSAVILPPLAGLMLLAAVRWPLPVAVTSTKRRKADSKPEPESQRQLLYRYFVALVGMGVVAVLVLQVVYLFPRDPLQYLDGWRNIYGEPVKGFQGYMAGHLAPRFYSYYLVAYLLKEPLASIALTGFGIWLAMRNRSISPLARAFLLLPPALLVAGYSVMSFNIGIRYLIPALPFAHLLGGLALATLIQSAKMPVRTLGVALGTWIVVAAAGIYPDHLSYFNEAACILDDPRKLGLDGGSRCGPAWLDDSNVDWGQGLKQLRAWLDANAAGRPVRIGYFGTIPPEAYGVRATPMNDDDILYGRSPGIYAVSAHIVASTPAVARSARVGGAEWLRRPPEAIVGHAYYIFDVRSAAGR